MSSYPPPPGTPTTPGDSAGDAREPSPSSQQQHGLPIFDGLPHDLGELASPAGAAAAAQHGLHALQAATAEGELGQSAAAFDPNSFPAPNDPAPAATPSQSVAPPQKLTRLRRACDMCSQRKVRCDEVQPCRPCRDLNVDCTFNREMKRRGPPNKHAEAARKRLRSETSGIPSVPGLPHLSPAPPHSAYVQPQQHEHVDMHTLASLAAVTQDLHDRPSAELIAPWKTLVLLVDDFFTYIYPLAPFPHEPTFRAALNRREDRDSSDFLALIASMIGALVSSFPKAARELLKSQQNLHLFPNAKSLIDRCREVALDARGTAFMSKDRMSVNDAATSYFLGLAAAYTMQWKLYKRFMNECLVILRELGFHKKQDLGLANYNVIHRGPAPPFTCIEDQVGKRIFWALFLAARSMAQLNMPHAEIFMHVPASFEPYPDLPNEIDDECIIDSHIMGQPEGRISLMTGFNAAVNVQLTMNALFDLRLYDELTSLDFSDLKQTLRFGIDTVKETVSRLPSELAFPAIDGTESATLGVFTRHDYKYCAPSPGRQPPNDIRNIIKSDTIYLREVQFQIQKANIHVSQLATRSYFIETYFQVRDAHKHKLEQTAKRALDPDKIDQTLDSALNGDANINSSIENNDSAAATAEVEQPDDFDAFFGEDREAIVQGLLFVLGRLFPLAIECNGSSVTNKVRQVASTIIPNAEGRSNAPLVPKEIHMLQRFLAILVRLERNSGLFGNNAMTQGIEEQEARDWEDFAKEKARLLASGGLTVTDA